MSHILLVQRLRTCWTKASRGGAGAVLRNRVPEIAEVPPQCLRPEGAGYVLHELTFVERDDFAAPQESLEIHGEREPFSVGCVRITRGLEAVTLEYRWDRGCAGAPERGWSRNVVTIRAGEWAQIRYNGRFSVGWDCVWKYEKNVLNVGLFPALEGNAFRGSEPAVRFSDMAHLI